MKKEYTLIQGNIDDCIEGKTLGIMMTIGDNMPQDKQDMVAAEALKAIRLSENEGKLS